MNPASLRALLDKVKSGAVSPESAMQELATLPFEDLGVARVDHHRHLRMGSPEVVFGEGKTAQQIALIAGKILNHHGRALVTRVDSDKATAVQSELGQLKYDAVSRILSCATRPAEPIDVSPVAIVAAGTSDAPVAEEAAQTLEFEGVGCQRVYDVGVAGLHRLMDSLPQLGGASAIIVVAGMEGALPSVVGGLVAQPIIAVPTSVGYGAALSGFAALFAMLTSCASGVTVVNIDNGFGAAMAALRIVRLKRGAGALQTPPGSHESAQGAP